MREASEVLEVSEVCVWACVRLCMLDAVESGLCLLEALEVMRCMLPYMLEAVEGEFCSLEVL